jgi:hypothetical protein
LHARQRLQPIVELGTVIRKRVNCRKRHVGNRLHYGKKVATAVLELVDEHLPGSLQTLVGGDVRKCDHDAVDDVLDGAVRSDAHEETCGATLEVELAFDSTERALHLLNIAVKLIIRQLGNDVGDGAAAVHLA